jgi:uncharacterized protein YjbJ (UPF0337 family)
MSLRDKMRNAAQKSSGKAKQVGGRAAGRPDAERRGRRKQVGADLKNAGEHVKDAGGKAKRAFKH